MGNRRHYEGVETLAVLLSIFAICWHFLWPERRVIWGGASNGPVALTFFAIHIWIAFYAIAFAMFLQRFSPHTLVVLNWALQPPIMQIGGIFTIASCLVLTLLHLPGVWWTWNTIAMYAGVMLLTIHFVEARAGPFHALTLAIGVFALSAGIWELPYQLGYAMRYPADVSVSVWMHFSGQAYRVMPLYVGGGFVLFAYALRDVRPHLNWDAVLLWLITLGGFSAWWLSGFWVDIRWDPVANVWYHTVPAEHAYLQMVFWRASKAALALAVAAMYWPKGLLIRGIYGHILAGLWLCAWVATSVFLAVTWIKAQFAKPSHPYFYTRSIYNGRALKTQEPPRRNNA